jgi:hypothetical protein
MLLKYLLSLLFYRPLCRLKNNLIFVENICSQYQLPKINIVTIYGVKIKINVPLFSNILFKILKGLFYILIDAVCIFSSIRE